MAVKLDSTFIKLCVCVKKSNFLSWAIRTVFVDPVTYSVSPVDTCTYGYDGGLVEETMTISSRLPHRKQMHVSHIPLKLQKRNKDFQTLHEQANTMVYSLNQVESFFFEYWPNKNLRIFLCMHNFTKYF